MTTEEFIQETTERGSVFIYKNLDLDLLSNISHKIKSTFPGKNPDTIIFSTKVFADALIQILESINAHYEQSKSVGFFQTEYSLLGFIPEITFYVGGINFTVIAKHGTEYTLIVADNGEVPSPRKSIVIRKDYEI